MGQFHLHFALYKKIKIIVDQPNFQLRSSMQIGIPKEIHKGETRVAATPETVKKYIINNHTVVVEKDAGAAANFSNKDYTESGAVIGTTNETLACELVLKVNSPNDLELSMMKSGTVIIGMLNPFNIENLNKISKAGLTAFSLEAVPRVTRAQSMDVLSSQASLSGYKAVLLAVQYYQRFVPMMMTAAGTLRAARVLVLGAGVAGLQAIATAKRLGAIVEASDVRPMAKEQVESLGAKFIDVPFETNEEEAIAKGKDGYARSMPKSWMDRQSALVSEKCKNSDIVIATALIPGKPAPKLVFESTVRSMKPGSIIVDIAAGFGGNCELSEPDKVLEKYGITLIGFTNLPAKISTDASILYSNNLFNFVKLISNEKGSLDIKQDDEIVKTCLMCFENTIFRG